MDAILNIHSIPVPTWPPLQHNIFPHIINHVPLQCTTSPHSGYFYFHTWWLLQCTMSTHAAYYSTVYPHRELDTIEHIPSLHQLQDLTSHHSTHFSTPYFPTYCPHITPLQHSISPHNTHFSNPFPHTTPTSALHFPTQHPHQYFIFHTQHPIQYHMETAMAHMYIPTQCPPHGAYYSTLYSHYCAVYIPPHRAHHTERLVQEGKWGG